MTDTQVSPAVTYPSWMTAVERRTAERFPHDTKHHELAVLHVDGIYRHLRFRAPGTSLYWFDLITWPGTLVINGSCGSFAFSRVEDMFTFFRRNGNSSGINPSYWSEKLPTNQRDAVERYSETVFRDQLDQALAEYDEAYPELAARYKAELSVYEATPTRERYPWVRSGPREPGKPMAPADARQLVADCDDDWGLAHEAPVRHLLSELESGLVVSDPIEWNLHDWDWQFLWCCHAIVWGIAQYDAANAGTS